MAEKIIELKKGHTYLFREGIGGRLIEGTVRQVSATAFKIKWPSGNELWEDRSSFFPTIVFTTPKYRPVEDLTESAKLLSHA